MIRLSGVSLRRGDRALVEDASVLIAAGDRLALIGPNGSGKTSLLAALAGELSPDAGSIDNGARRVVRLSQSLPASDSSVIDHLLASDSVLASARSRLRAAESASDGHAIGEAHLQFSDAGGHDAEARASALLHGLGFDAAQIAAPVAKLSGGWRMRLNLAVSLFVPSDLLLLDEPTNHLDLDAIVWLERWLSRYPGTLLVVSHDRDFLDLVVRGTLSIEGRRLVRYVGGYSACEAQRAERQLVATRDRRRASERAAHLQQFIDRFRAQATKARQVQSRIKALERISISAGVRELDALDFGLPPVGETPNPLVTTDEVSIGHPAAPPLATGVRFTIARGDRIGLLGRNGVGKTTLIRTLIGETPPLSGEVWRSSSVRVGYFAQAAVEALRDDESPLQHLSRRAPARRDVDLRAMLARYGIRGGDATRAVGPMSGGERARLVLALTAIDAPQLLILDEPTNHLDAAARDALTESLAQFDGALLLVSHDRYLIRAVADRLVVLRDGRLEEFEGDVDDYVDALGARAPGTPSALRAQEPQAALAVDVDALAPETGETAEPDPTSRRDSRRLAAQRRAQLAQRRRPLEARVHDLERALEVASADIRGIDDAMSTDPTYFDDAARVAKDGRRRALLVRHTEELESQWLQAQTDLENLVRGADLP